jgi:hypothetical protein
MQSRQSSAITRNGSIEVQHTGGSNIDWIRAAPEHLVSAGTLILFGGASVLEFRVRVAQSRLRQDLLPSFWSQVGILASPSSFLTVPYDDRLTPSCVPEKNAIRECPLDAYANAERYPNIALIQFVRNGTSILENARRLQYQRSVADLPQLLIAWLAFAWGTGDAPNPLTQNMGLPAATMVETAYGIDGVELTPGVASAASCPEAIWQSAIWWHEFYQRTSDAYAKDAPAQSDGDTRGVPQVVRPNGVYVTRQPAAAVIE